MRNQPLTHSKQQLTYAAAAIAIEAAVAKSREIAAPECIAVVDTAQGNLLAFARVEGAAVLARDPAIAKAATSASIGAPTGGIPSSSARDLGFASHGGIANLGGGFPIVFRGELVGAIAASDLEPPNRIFFTTVSAQKPGEKAILAALSRFRMTAAPA